MSYNITQWETIEIKELKIPLNALYESPRKDLHPEEIKLIDFDKMQFRIECFDGFIKGTVNDQIMTVEEIKIRGVGSGVFMSYILNDALKQSTGALKARLIWEGGDSITEFSVNDGALENKNI